MKKIIAGICGVTLLTIIWFAQSKFTTNDSNKIVIGMMSGWAPFMSINQQGKFEGFDIDIANELCTRLNKPCQISDLGALTSLFVALEKNKIDMIFSGLDITDARRQKMNMVPYFGEDLKEYWLLFWKEIPEGIATLADFKKLSNRAIVIEPGVGPEKYLDQFAFIEKKQIAALADRLLDLKYGKSTALFLEPKMAKELMRKNPELKSLSIPLPVEFQIYGMGIALKKSDPRGDEIKNAIAAMKADGTIAKLAARWFVEENSNDI